MQLLQSRAEPVHAELSEGESIGLTYRPKSRLHRLVLSVA